MDELKFRLKVWKMKCPDCDTLYLVEVKPKHAPYFCTCPICESDNSEHMGDIMIIEEGETK